MLDLTPRPTPAAAPEATDPVVAGPQTWTAAGLLVAAAVVSLVSIFPDYFAGQRLDRADEIVPVVVVLAGWLASGLAVANRHARWVAVGGALGLGVAAADLGQRLTDVGQLSGGVSGGPGLWLHVAAWVVGALGSVLALVTAGRAGALGRPRRPGPAPAADRLLGVIAVVAGLLAAVVFVPSWDRYLITTAANPGVVVSRTLGYAFDSANPGLVIAGNVLTAVAFGLVPIAAALWRPVRVGAALALGTAVVLAAQVISAAVQVLETPDPRQVLSAGDIARFRPTVSLHLTGWYDAELVALLVLLVVAASRLHHPGHRVGAAAVDEPTGAAPDGGPGAPPAAAPAAPGGWSSSAAPAPSWGHVPPPPADDGAAGPGGPGWSGR
ncbi:MAG TPA: hypothetical protein VFP61_07950 [Acidimicrobiales bacterium]|nr:hypothetical protein [Acidimicrobiales bacterium]